MATEADYLALCGWVDDKPKREREIERSGVLNLDDAAPKLRMFAAPVDVLFWEIEEKLFGSILQTQLLNTAQAIGDCFPAGTPVRMADGSEKAIEDVHKGDTVLTHTNQARVVLDTISKSYSGDLVTMKVHGYAGTITATPDHRFINFPNIPYGRNDVDTYQAINEDMKWKAIGELEQGERVLMPWGMQTDDALPQRAGKYVVDERFARVVGLYLAEGGVTGTKTSPMAKIVFNFGAHERMLIEETKALMKSIFGLDGHEYRKKETVTVVNFHSVEVAAFFKELVPGNTYSKRVPDVFQRSPRTVKLALMRGWLDGDGHDKPRKVQGTTASPNLLRDMHAVALSMKLRVRSLLRKKESHQRVASGDVFLYAKEFAAFQSGKSARCSGRDRRDVTEHGIAASIQSVTRHAVVNETVYCLCVEEEHSFVANGFAVHNCVSWGEGQAVQDTILMNLAANAAKEDWLGEVATEPIYGGSRCEIGGWYGDNSDGSIGLYGARWTKEYGILLRKKYGAIDLSTYSGSRAKQYGSKGCPDELEPIAKERPITDYAIVKSYEGVRDALCAGKPVANASSAGFDMKRGPQGICRRSTTWMHEMCYRGHCVIKGNKPMVVQKNSWADYLSDLNNKVELESGRTITLPKGHFLVYPEDVTFQAKQGDTTAKAGVKGWEPQTFSWNI